MDEIILKPSADDIKSAGEFFDAENRDIEEALRELFRQYPDNAQKPHVLLKVTALNTLYSTQIPLYRERVLTILDVVNHIVNLGIDAELSRGDDSLVPRLAAAASPNKGARFYYTFATKYCNWHTPRSYPIYDSWVVAYLWHLRHHDLLYKFGKVDLWYYPRFKGIVESFRTKNGLESFTFKEIYKFLYLQGRLLIRGPEREIDEFGAIVVPDLEYPGVMEWSVENYPSPEEAERSLKAFTDNAGWQVVEMPITVANGNACFGKQAPLFLMPLSSFPDYFQAFLSHDPDTQKIETLGANLALHDFPQPEMIDFVKEVCKWGGYPGIAGRVLKNNSISDICETFRDATSILSTSESVADALIRVNKLHGLGSTSFASKHLRFLKPNLCGVYDSILENVLPYPSRPAGYSDFCRDLSSVAQELMRNGISNPPRQGGAWFVADVEAALYDFVCYGDLSKRS